MFQPGPQFKNSHQGNPTSPNNIPLSIQLFISFWKLICEKDESIGGADHALEPPESAALGGDHGLGKWLNC